MNPKEEITFGVTKIQQKKQLSLSGNVQAHDTNKRIFTIWSKLSFFRFQ